MSDLGFYVRTSPHLRMSGEARATDEATSKVERVASNILRRRSSKDCRGMGRRTWITLVLRLLLISRKTCHSVHRSESDAEKKVSPPLGFLGPFRLNGGEDVPILLQILLPSVGHSSVFIRPFTTHIKVEVISK